MIRRIGLAVGLTALLFAGAITTADAETATVGQLFTPANNCVGPFTYLFTASPSGFASYTIPFDGVITSWAWHAGQTPVTDLKLKVGHAAGGGQYVFDAELPAGTQTPYAATRYPADIPVHAGDFIGITQNGGSCASHDAGYDETYWVGDIAPSPNPTSPFATSGDSVSPVQVTVTQTPAQPTGQVPVTPAKKKKCKKKHSAFSAKKKKCKKNKKK
jgi:hypothetical protein